MKSDFDIADFVQKYGAVVGGFEYAHAVAIGSGVRAFQGSEQFAFQQRRRDGAAIDRHETAAGRGAMLR